MKDGKIPRVETSRRLTAAARKGLVRLGSGWIPREILSQDPPGEPVGALAALLEERRVR